MPSLPSCPHDYLEVHLRFVPDAASGPDADAVPDEDRREVELVPVGPRWSARVRALGTAIARWTVAGGGDGC